MKKIALFMAALAEGTAASLAVMAVSFAVMAGSLAVMVVSLVGTAVSLVGTAARDAVLFVKRCGTLRREMRESQARLAGMAGALRGREAPAEGVTEDPAVRKAYRWGWSEGEASPSLCILMSRGGGK
ncbi:MAG: hypothetical protein LBG27_04305 [Spirochaetaceae bacterium]|jgi:hypothetical protein|nr:hypothetical protein [Spirochaetaceae bacterium]